jgi:hypothetical protein
LAPAAKVTDGGNGGVDWTTIALGLAGSLLAIGAVAGALLALALRVVPALARAWRLVAPRVTAAPEIALLRPAAFTRPLAPRFVSLARDRAPPVFA